MIQKVGTIEADALEDFLGLGVFTIEESGWKGLK